MRHWAPVGSASDATVSRRGGPQAGQADRPKKSHLAVAFFRQSRERLLLHGVLGGIGSLLGGVGSSTGSSAGILGGRRGSTSVLGNTGGGGGSVRGDGSGARGGSSSARSGDSSARSGDSSGISSRGRGSGRSRGSSGSRRGRRSGFFFFATGGQGSSSNHGRQNEGVFHFDIPKGIGHKQFPEIVRATAGTAMTERKHSSSFRSATNYNLKFRNTYKPCPDGRGLESLTNRGSWSENQPNSGASIPRWTPARPVAARESPCRPRYFAQCPGVAGSSRKSTRHSEG